VRLDRDRRDRAGSGTSLLHLITIRSKDESMSTVVVGATQGTGRALAEEYARRGARVVITGRRAERAAAVAAEIDGDVTGIALDLTRPGEIAAALESVERVDRVVLAGVVRDASTVATFDVETAVLLATTKVVGYAAVVSALRERLNPGASVLLFGGISKDHPYPGSTVISAANAAVRGLVRTLSIELAPIRVNSVHPTGIEDSPQWAGNTAVLDGARKASLAGRLPTMGDVVDGCVFLLENPVANGIDLRLYGGHA
jgi:NAD(P)-dependent dehydrogenase (short-subunit alcohol dehydrogenase family)